MMDVGFGLGSFWMLLGPLVWVALLTLVVAGVWKVVGAGARPDSSPADVLKHRYARGEIDEAEYLRTQKTLE